MIICAKGERKGLKNFVRVYADKNSEFLLNGELYNYTSKTVAIKIKNDIFIYNEEQELIKKIKNDKTDVNNIVNGPIG